MRCAATGSRFRLRRHTISTRFVSFKTKILCKSAKSECKAKAMEPLASKAWRCKLQLQGLSGVACSLTLRSRGGPTACHRAPSPGTVYIFCPRGLASYRCCPPLAPTLGVTKTLHDTYQPLHRHDCSTHVHAPSEQPGRDHRSTSTKVLDLPGRTH
jgi:hypothetical protein